METEYTPIRARRVLNIVSLAGGWDVLDISVGPDHEPLVLLWERPAIVPEHPEEALRPGISVQRRRAEGPNRFRLIHGGRDRPVVIDVPTTRRSYALARPLGFGTYLLYGYDGQSATVVRRTGSVVRSIELGHGISMLETTPAGHIWTGCHDQGLGPHGKIACLDREGHLLLSLDKLVRDHGLPDIIDCYAISPLSDHVAWVWYYHGGGHGWTLLRVDGMGIDEAWPDLPISGSQAFAVVNHQVLFRGGFRVTDREDVRARADRFNFVDLDAGWVRQFIPVDEMDIPVVPGTAFGRGEQLYFETDGELFAVDAMALVASLPG